MSGGNDASNGDVMADDHRHTHRADPFAGRPSAGASSANDPLAELARLIGQTDPFAEYGRGQQAPQAAPQAVPQAQWAAPNMPSHTPSRMAAHENPPPAFQPAPTPHYAQQAQAGLPPGYDQGVPVADHGAPVYAQDYGNDGGAEYYDDVPPRRRISVLAIAGLFAVAVIGTTGAFGYRLLFGSSGSSPPPVIKADAKPTKVVPPNSSQGQAKAISDRIGDASQSEKIVPREEKPVDLIERAISSSSPLPEPSGEQPAQSAAGPNEPKRVKTIAIRPDQNGLPAAVESAASQVPPPRPPVAQTSPALAAAAVGPSPVRAAAPTAAPVAPRNSGPLALTPDAVAAAPVARTAAVASAPPPSEASASGGYSVQLSSQRSEAEARAAFQSMQGRFPSQLGGRQPVIRRADLGAKGIYYRALVGPFANSADASALCGSLKAAGGQCLIQRN